MARLPMQSLFCSPTLYHLELPCLVLIAIWRLNLNRIKPWDSQSNFGRGFSIPATAVEPARFGVSVRHLTGRPALT
jgi:hypothetical protein